MLAELMVELMTENPELSEEQCREALGAARGGRRLETAHRQAAQALSAHEAASAACAPGGADAATAGGGIDREEQEEGGGLSAEFLLRKRFAESRVQQDVDAALAALDAVDRAEQSAPPAPTPGGDAPAQRPESARAGARRPASARAAMPPPVAAVAAAAARPGSARAGARRAPEGGAAPGPEPETWEQPVADAWLLPKARAAARQALAPEERACLDSQLFDAASRGSVGEVQALLGRGALPDAYRSKVRLSLCAGHCAPRVCRLRRCTARVPGVLCGLARWRPAPAPGPPSLSAQCQLAADPRLAAVAQNKATALHTSAARGFTDVVASLLAVGAEKGALNKFRQTPLKLASKYERTEASRLLTKHSRIGVARPRTKLDRPGSGRAAQVQAGGVASASSRAKPRPGPRCTF